MWMHDLGFDLKKHFNKPMKGAIHIGAHQGQEKKYYDHFGINPIVWIEANSEYEFGLKELFPEDMVIISGVGSENKKEKFKIANNGQSSSFLNLGTHEKEHPNVSFIDEMDIEIKPMTQLISENNIIVENYNFLNVDVQGYELEVFKGFGDYLNNFDYVYCEVNEDFLYENCALISDIDAYLSKYNLERVETYMTHHKWGDALYIKK
jgi:FkbM family methyltransferase